MSNLVAGRETGPGRRQQLAMTTAQRTAFTPSVGQPVWDTDTSELYEGDGSTAGGVSVSGALARLQQEVVTSPVAFVDFDFPAGYTAFKIAISNMHVTSDPQDVDLRFSNDGGSSFITSASYKWQRHLLNSNGGESISSSNGSSLIRVSGELGNLSSESLSGFIDIFDPRDSSSIPRLTYHITLTDDVGLSTNVIGSGQYNNQGDFNAIRIFPNNTFDGGTFTLYGYKG